MAVNVKFFLAGFVLFLPWFQAFVEACGFVFVDLEHGALMVYPLPSVQGARLQLLYHHRRGVCPVFKADVELFAAFKASAT